jgi:hypothetical protein
VTDPYCSTGERGPRPDDVIWPGFDHPFVNRVRELREFVGDQTRLTGWINPAGPDGRFTAREISYEEVRWMVLAAIGADFDGAIWGVQLETQPWRDRLRRLQQDLNSYAVELGYARPVAWARDSRQTGSALSAGDLLFVVLLHPDFMRPLSGGERGVALPVAPPPRRGEVLISPPEGIQVISAQTISGRALPLQAGPEGWRVNYRYTGSGEMFVVRLSATPSKSPASQPAP